MNKLKYTCIILMNFFPPYDSQRRIQEFGKRGRKQTFSGGVNQNLGAVLAEWLSYWLADQEYRGSTSRPRN